MKIAHCFCVLGFFSCACVHLSADINSTRNLHINTYRSQITTIRWLRIPLHSVLGAVCVQHTLTHVGNLLRCCFARNPHPPKRNETRFNQAIYLRFVCSGCCNGKLNDPQMRCGCLPLSDGGDCVFCYDYFPSTMNSYEVKERIIHSSRGLDARRHTITWQTCGQTK